MFQYLLVWIVILLLVLAVVLLAAVDIWSTRLFSLRQQRKILDDRRAMLEREVARYRRRGQWAWVIYQRPFARFGGLRRQSSECFLDAASPATVKFLVERSGTRPASGGTGAESGGGTRCNPARPTSVPPVSSYKLAA